VNKIEKYKNIWEDYLSDNYFPTAIRNLRKIEFSVFKEMVNNNEEETRKLILDMLSGDVVILKNAIPTNVAKQIKKDL
jgi:hypothetical protein